MTTCLSKDVEHWIVIRKCFSEKISKLEESETELKCQLDAIEKLIEKRQNAYTSRHDCKACYKISHIHPFPENFRTCTQTTEAIKTFRRPSSASLTVAKSCICNPCLFKKSSSNQIACLCTRNEESETSALHKPEFYGSKEQQLTALLHKIEKSAPEILARDIRLPSLCVEITDVATEELEDISGDDFEALVKKKIMPIIEDMLENFCNSCQDVQQLLDPLQSSNVCPCLQIMTTPTKPEGRSSCPYSKCPCVSSKSLDQQYKSSESGGEESVKQPLQPKTETLSCACNTCDMKPGIVEEKSLSLQKLSETKNECQKCTCETYDFKSAVAKIREHLKRVCFVNKSKNAERISECNCENCRRKKSLQIESSVRLIRCECPKCIPKFSTSDKSSTVCES